MIAAPLTPVLGGQAGMAAARLAALDMAALLQLLTPDERAGAQRYAREQDRHAHIAGRALARSALGAAMGIAPVAVPLTIGADGKPQVAGGPAFNISHSGDHVLLALAHVPGWAVGIDVEVHDRRTEVQKLERLVFDPAEIAWLAAEPDRREAFFRLWVLKEAVLKAAGTGLSVDPRAMILDPRGLLLQSSEPALQGEWQLEDLDHGAGVSAALALFRPA